MAAACTSDGADLPSCHALDSVAGRQRCAGCGRSRRFYCYDCVRTMPQVEHLLPGKVELPFRVHVLLHGAEAAAKSTGVQLGVLAADAAVYQLPRDQHRVPAFDCDDSALLFADECAPSVADFARRWCTDPPATAAGVKPMSNLVILDCTWGYAKSFRKHASVSHLRSLAVPNRRTCYWRPQNGHAHTDLATIEAGYYASLELLHHGREWPALLRSDRGDRPPPRVADLLYFYDYHLRIVNGAPFTFDGVQCACEQQ